MNELYADTKVFEKAAQRIVKSIIAEAEKEDIFLAEYKNKGSCYKV
ncbi:MAG: hypothetical protein ACTTKL_09445 [Treponema sp.]